MALNLPVDLVGEATGLRGSRSSGIVAALADLAQAMHRYDLIDFPLSVESRTSMSARASSRAERGAKPPFIGR